MAIEIIVLFCLILVNGAFAMSEIALVTARKGRLQKLVEQGDRGAAAAIELGEDSTRFLSTIQIGITSISILNGIVGEAAFAEPLGAWLQGWGVPARPAFYLATGLVVLVVTYFSIVFGELVPKRLGQLHPVPVARRVALPVLALARGTRVLVRLLSASTELILRICGVRDAGAAGVTQEEIHQILREGEESGVIEEHEHEMARNVFRLDDRPVGSLMVPRGEMLCIDLAQSLEENLRRIEASDLAQLPVVRGDPGRIIGVLDVRALVPRLLRGEAPDFTLDMEEPVYVPKSLSGMELLERFRTSGLRLAFVIDEYGDLLGRVSLRNVLEAITGELDPRSDEDARAVRRADGSWLLDGIIPITDVKDHLGLVSVPEEERERYHTLSGMMLLMLGRLPRVGDSADWAGWRFEIIDMDGKRIDRVLAARLPETRV